jgi:single-strand DNA-binding protein
MYQKTILIGYLGKDPEVSYTQGGTARARFSLATSETYNDRQSGERREETQWHTVIVWGKQAENAGKYLAKGHLVTVEGKIQYRTYDKNGVTHYVTEIKADRVVFMPKTGGKQDHGRAEGERHEGQGEGDPNGNAGEPAGGAEDEIPF